MKYFSLFSGIGGFEIGIEEGYKQQMSEWQSLQSKRNIANTSRKSKRKDRSECPTCVGYSEIDKYAIQIYQKHFPTHKNYGNATRIVPEELPGFDLLTFGWPCQDNSIAGNRKGQATDTRSGLLFEAVKILGAKKPKYFIAENVEGLFSVNRGYDFYTTIRMFSDIGYEYQWQLLNTSWFLPQNRPRIYFVGHLRGTSRPKVFPIGEGNEISYKGRKKRKVKDQLSSTILSNLKRGVHSGGETLIYEGAIMSEKNKEWIEDGKQLGRNFPQGQRVYSARGIASSICGTAGGLGGKTGLYSIQRCGDRDKKTYSLKKEAHCLCVNPQSDYLPKVTDGIRVRCLTPTECERLQGFPDGWTEGLSDTQRYKCLGNAVTVNVVAEIVKRLMEQIDA